MSFGGLKDDKAKEGFAGKGLSGEKPAFANQGTPAVYCWCRCVEPLHAYFLFFIYFIYLFFQYYIMHAFMSYF